jgi:5'-nucleotidase
MQKGGCSPTDGCQDGDGFAGARFQYLAANVIDRTTSGPIFPATAVRTVGGVKIGFIGETLKGTAQVTLPSGIRGLTFLDEATTANAHAARLKRQGVHAIVLLIHQGGRQRPADQDADPNGCDGFQGGLDSILDGLSPDIKVVISGHSHRLYNCTVAGRLVTSAGSYGRVITRLNLTIDSSNDVIVGATARNEIVTRDVEKDAAQTRLIAKYGALSKPIADRPVGSVTSNIPRRLNNAGESALGDVIADSQLASAGPAIKGGAVVAFMNAGGIRSDVIVDEGGAGLPGGRVTYGQLHSVLPFGNVVTVRTMTGAMIRRVLEQQFDNPGPNQQTFLQVSSGFTYRYLLNAPAGRHVDPTSIKIRGRLVGPVDRVRVAANNFLVAGGDNFTVFEEGTAGVGGDVDIDALVAYFRTKSPIRPGPQDRIVRTD